MLSLNVDQTVGADQAALIVYHRGELNTVLRLCGNCQVSIFLSYHGS